MFYLPVIIYLTIHVTCGFAEPPLAQPPAAKFTQYYQDHMVLEGDPLTLTCEVVGDLPPPGIVQWGNDSVPIAQDNLSFFPDLLNTEVNGNVYTLTILSARLADEGNYTCNIISTRGLAVHHVVVNIPATIIKPQTEYELVVGDSLRVPCEAEGKPLPAVTWTWLDGSFPGHRSTLDVDDLHIQFAQELDGGRFQCRAENLPGMEDTWDITVTILYPPQLEARPDYIHTGPGGAVEMECAVRAGPHADVEWHFNGAPFDTQHAQRHIIQTTQAGELGHTIYRLNIPEVLESDIGRYECHAENSEGNAFAAIKLRAIPERLVMVSPVQGRYSNYYVLHWQFVSYADPVECYLDVTQRGVNGTDYFGNVTVPAQGGSTIQNVRDASYTFQGLSANMNYTVAIQCKNTYDISDWSKLLKFSTSEEENVGQPPIFEYEENNVIPKDQDDNSYVDTTFAPFDTTTTVFSDTYTQTVDMEIGGSLENGSQSVRFIPTLSLLTILLTIVCL